MNERLGHYKEYRDNYIRTPNDDELNLSDYSDELFNFLNDEVGQLKGDRSYLNSSVFPRPRSGVGKMMDQEFFMHTVKAMDIPKSDTTDAMNVYVRLAQKWQDVIVHLLKERDPENISVAQRLKNIDISSLLINFFSSYHINLPFSYEIMNKTELLKKIPAENFYSVELFPQDWVKKEYYLGVKFDSVRSIML